MKILKLILAFLFIQTSIVVPAKADDTSEDLTVVVGDLQTMAANNLSRVSVTNPEIADISDAKADKIIVVAKKAGQTAMFFWDDDGKHTVSVHVVAQDLKVLQERIHRLLLDADIKDVKLEASPAEGKVVISGGLVKEKKALLEKILDPYAEQVINLVVEEASQDLIQIDMQITELSTTLDKNLGFDWQAGPSGQGNALALDYTENATPTGGSPNWFKFGQFNRTTAIVNTINLLINEGKARDLSRPRIMVTSGKEATINVGGEVPIQSTTTNATGGSSQSNITFKQYGVTLTVTPTIKDGNKIDVLMNLEVSDVDKTFPIKPTTTNDIAYKTRSAQTQLLLDDRQTVVFAGLIRYNDSQQVKQLPFLGKIPIVGLLFRNEYKQAPDEGKELVISLTPRILTEKKIATTQMKLPTQAQEEFVKEIDQTKNYQQEPLPPAKGVVVPAPAVPAPAGVPSPAAQLTVPYASTSAPSEVSPYVRSIQMKISQAISYPYEALQNNWQGTVKLKLRILKDGSLADASVVGSSGHDVFDTDALNTAKIVAPYGPFTADMHSEDLTLTLPIVYSQGSAVKTADTQTVVAAY